MSKADPRHDPFEALDTLETTSGKAQFYRLSRLENKNLCRVSELPYAIRILLESVLRNCDGYQVTEQDVRNVAGWSADSRDPIEVPFKPARVVLQDFTGVPSLVDLATMRSAMHRLGGDPKRINPLIPVDLVIDHSVQVDFFGTPDALEKNTDYEFRRNRERYEFLKWGQDAFDNFRVIPPAIGIVHQVNLEFLANCVVLREDPNGAPVAFPDTLVGTDSHTTMINGLGVLGWGVGGIEAEAVMLGQPIYMLLPEVVGVELSGRLPSGSTATDLVLTVTHMLREHGVVGKFVEFHGPGVSTMSLADRATIGNMSPEYGATMGFFPIDTETLNYLRRTGRTEETIDLVERYTKEQCLFRTDDASAPEYSSSLSLDLGSVEPTLAGPKRPQDSIALSAMKKSFHEALVAPFSERGFALDESALKQKAVVRNNGDSEEITHGAVVIAAITSCTNTSNPSVMLAAGLLARNALARGLQVPAHVKTSLAPGSRVVTDYLDRAGLSAALDQLGFDTVGYGCTTCIGNSGPLPEPVATAVIEGSLVAAAVLSGNRNFEGRVNPLVKANYLASPPLVVAYALAGTTDIDLTTEALGTGSDGKPVMLEDIWPGADEIKAAVEETVRPEMFRNRYGNVLESNPKWNEINTKGSDLYDWDPKSTYIQDPPFLVDLTPDVKPIQPIRDARVLLALGDSVTTDHISPAGSIAADGPAGRFLIEQGISQVDFNSYGSRRGNDRVLARGTFANIRIRNQLAPGTEGGITRHLPDGEQMAVYDAAMKYREEGVPLIVLAGAEYGTGSSRDWAAKGPQILGVRAVIAAGFERIHRSNLIGMGILPLESPPGKSWRELRLTGEEVFDIPQLDESLEPRQQIQVRSTSADGTVTEFDAKVRIDTPVELEYYRNGGILQTVLRNMLAEETA